MMNSPSIDKRNTSLKNASNKEFDLIVIGGGITGAGIALDASLRGLSVLLVEKGDFASGTSSRSTKLIHGGLRYLKQFDFGLVREVGTERAVLFKNAPHLVLPEKMLLPLTKKGTYSSLLTSVGLWIYDVLAGVKKAERKKMLSKSETLTQEPLLNEADLLGAGLYTEYRTNDSRLTFEVINTAIKSGALCFNYMKALSFENSNEIIKSIDCFDLIENTAYTFRAKKFVNACGPWVDTIRILDKKSSKKRLRLTKGVHLVVSFKKLPIQEAVYFDNSDGRMIFAIPVGEKTYFGTTDTDYTGDIDTLSISLEDVKYLIDAVNRMFKDTSMKVQDIETGWVGLRPLIQKKGKSPSELSRKDEIFQSKNGLISIAGGKLTGYRKMAEKVTDLVINKLGKSVAESLKKCSTKQIVLNGSEGINENNIDAFIQKIKVELLQLELPDSRANYLFRTYGSKFPQILKYREKYKGANAELDLIRMELRYSLEQESVFHLSDFLLRRTVRFQFELPLINEFIPHLMEDYGHYFNRTPEEIMEEYKLLNRVIKEATHFE